MSEKIILFLGVLLMSASQVVLADQLRDPTRPLSYAVVATKGQSLVLNSILISSERKLAIINGQTLRENDIINGSDGVRVTLIRANEVHLQQGAKQWKLSLNTTSVRQ